MLKNSQHDSTIFNIKTPEFYINMKSSDIPPKGHSDRQAFVQKELEKCIKGVSINGVFIPGSLYYDLNYHFIELDTENGRTVGHPRLRDNGWIIHNDYYQAQQNKEHYCVAGGRQLGKSDILTSLTMREIAIYDGTAAMLLFSNSEDKVTFSGKMKVAHDYQIDFLKVPLLDKDFNKSFLRFGFKETTNDNELHAKLYLLNTDGGNNAEIAASKTITFFAFDEIAKAPFKESWDAAQPAFRGKFGFRNSGFFAFTGGQVERSKDAEKFFMNPKANKVYAINGTGRFMDGSHRADLKKEGTFPEYLKCSQNIDIPVNSELYTIPCEYVNKEEAFRILDEESDNLLKSGETESYNKHKIYNPRKVSDMFLKENANPFSDISSELEKLYDFLGTQDYHTQTYKLEENGDEVIATPLDQHYDPFSINLDQPLVILDKPRNIEENVKVFVAGADPFNVNKTSQSPSIGSFYIIRKATSDYSDPYQETMVAWYNGRKDINDFREKLRLTLKYYGAHYGAVTLLHEAADDTLTQWFMDRKIGYWLENTYQLAKQIFSNTKAFAAKGLRPTTRNQDYYISKIRDYLTEELPDGRLGLWRIKDKLLVKHLLSYEGNLGDKDTLVSFGHALVHLYKERNYIPKISEIKEKVSASDIVKAYKSGFGFNLPKVKKSKSMI